MASLLQNNEKYLEKMRYVFEVFKKNQDEVALLWRPHPLMEATISSMRPQMRQEYDKLVRRYKEAGWGIYDDSSDLDRAVVISDIYYGDSSSVVALFKHIGKEVVIQSIAITPNRIQNMMEWAISYGDKFYFSSLEFNGICSWDLQNGLINIESYIEEDKRCIYRAYGYGKQSNNKLYMAPLMSDKVIIYDLQDKNYSWIGLPGMDDEILKHQKCSGIIIHDNEIFLMPKSEYYPYIVQININTQETKMYDCKKYCQSLKSVFCNASVEFNDEKFFFCLHGNLYEFLYITGEIRKITVRSDGKVKDICVAGDQIIVMGDTVVIYDHAWDIIKEIRFDSCKIPGNVKLDKVYRWENYIYLYSNYSTDAQQIYRIDIQTKERIVTNIEEKNRYYISLVADTKGICFMYFIDGRVYTIDEKLHISEHKVKIEFEFEKYLLTDKNWKENLRSTYNCLNETDILMRSLCSLSGKDVI